MSYRILIDGQQRGDPVDWDGIECELKRDYKARVISVQYGTTVTFSGGAHAYLRSRYEALGHCTESTIVVQETCGGTMVTVLSGRIIYSDCVWHLDRCAVECSIIDDGLGARIHNNMKVAVYPGTNRSKSGEAIDPLDALAMTFVGTNGAAVAGTRRMFDWLAAFRHALLFVTDGTVGVVSDWYDALPDDERYAIGMGVDIRLPGGATLAATWTLDDLWRELSLKYDLWMFPVLTESGTPVVRIEPSPYFFGPVDGLLLQGVPGITESIDTDRLYAAVNVGSEEVIKEFQAANPLPYISLLGFSEERMNFEGQCNTDATLDLVTKWIIDPNIIYRVLGGSTDWDGDMFMVQYDRTTVRTTVAQYLTPGSDPQLLNPALLNSAVLSRMPLRSAVGAEIGSDDANSFRSEYTGGQPEALYAAPWTGSPEQGRHQQQFDNDYTPPNFDISNAWGNGTTPGNPVAAIDSRFRPTVQGMYILSMVVRWRVRYWYSGDVNMILPLFRLFGVATVYDGLDNPVIQSVQFSTELRDDPSDGIAASALNFPLVVDPSQYVSFELYTWRYPGAHSTYALSKGVPAGVLPPNTQGSEIEILPGTFVECTNRIMAVRVQPTVPERVRVYELEKAIGPGDWKHLTQQPQDGVNAPPAHGWVTEAKRKLRGGKTTFKLIG